jgi:type VI secretion system protein ImpA
MDSIDGLLEPIEGDEPAGPDLRYEPVYDEIKRAREEEDDTMPQGEWKRELKVADFPLVVKLATEVLSDRSKDLQIAAWLTEAWTREEGFAGLDRGLVLLRRLMEEFWDGLHPGIDEDGDLEFRAVPLEWLGRYLQPSVEHVPITSSGLGYLHYRESRTVPTESQAESDKDKAKARNEAIESGKVTPEEFEEGVQSSGKEFYRGVVARIESAQENLSALEDFCDERFGDVTPNLIPLRDHLEELHRLTGQYLAVKLEEDPDPVVMEEEPASAEGEEAAPSAEVGAPGGTREALTEISSAADASRAAAEAARFLRRKRPADPSPYLMLRGLRWGELRASGDGVDPKLLTAPPTHVRTRLKGYTLDGKWAELLDACEEVMATPHGRGWLDLQRYALEACEGLGSEFDVVAGAIKGALAALLNDLPDLPGMTLMDDSPTANSETQGWLREAIGFGSENGDGSITVPDSSDPDRALERQVARLRTTQPHQAIQMLMRQASQEKSSRARFLRRSQAASIMVESGLESVALPILREMVEQVERHSLEDWEEGETVAQPLALLYRCMEKTDGDAGERQQLYLRICRLDPMQAMTFGTGSAGEGG